MRNRITEFAFHWMVPVWCAVTLVDLFYWGLPDWLRVISFVLILPAMLFCVIFCWAHGNSLCLSCIRSVSDNPENEIRTKARWLRFHHWIGNHIFKWLSVLVVTLAFTYFIQFVVSDTDWINHLSNVPLDVAALSAMFAGAVHHRLSAWCPWCRGFEDNDDEIIVPDPVPSGEKQS